MSQGTSLYCPHVNAEIARTSPRNLSWFIFENVGSWLAKGLSRLYTLTTGFQHHFTTAAPLMCYRA